METAPPASPNLLRRHLFPKSCRRRLLLACVFSSVVVLNASAQQTPPKIEVGGRPRTFGELLRERNVELTEPALLRALKSSDADVRFLSAMKLAEDKVVGTVPGIKAALAAETVPRDRVNLAFALGLLGEPSGHDELKKICAEENFASEFRLYAVRYMFDLGAEKDEGCLHAALDIAKFVDPGNRSVGDRITVFELLARFRKLTSEESQSVFDLLKHRSPFRFRLSVCLLRCHPGDSASSPEVTRCSSVPCRPQTPWCGVGE